MSDVLYDFKKAHRKATKRLVEAELEHSANYGHDLDCAYMRMAIAQEENRGVRLSAEEVTALLRLDDAVMTAADEVCKKLIGRYPGEEPGLLDGAIVGLKGKVTP